MKMNSNRYRAWWHHFALNLGVMLSCLVYMWWPPDWHHSNDDMTGLAKGTFRDWFRRGWE